MNTFYKVSTFLVLVVFLLQSQTSNTFRILTAAPFFASSHAKFVQSVMLHLAKRGHDVTIIAGNLVKDPPQNYHQIPVDYNPYIEKVKDISIWSHRNKTVLDQLFFTWDQSLIAHEIVFKSPELIDFIENDNSHFDLVIVEMFFEEIMYMFAHKYKAPLVLLDTTSMKRQVEDIMGNPVHVSYVPFEFLKHNQDFSVMVRFSNWFINMVDIVGRKFYLLPQQEALAKEVFKNLPGPLPSLEELQNNASLVLLNTHFSIDTTMPLVPGIVQIGGAHIDPVKKLPDDIQKFLDEAHDGAILFTMGNHVPIDTMEESKLNALLKVLGALKQRIIMKWDSEDVPTLKNALFGKWLPQNDILAHPNLKAFITHGGMLGTQEAVDKGVPIVGIPVFADQYLNVGRMVELGVAVKLDLATIDEKTAKEALEQVLEDQSYRERMKELSYRFRDRLSSPLDTATYWIEYVIRHKGAPFLKSPLARMPWYKYRMLDVIILALVLLGTMVGGILYVRKLSRKRTNKSHERLIEKIKKH